MPHRFRPPVLSLALLFIGTCDLAAQAPQGSPSPAVTPVRLTFVGDVNLGTITLPAGLPANDGRGLLDAAHSALRGDMVIANLEGPFVDGGRSSKCSPRSTACYAFGTPVRYAARLRDAGVTHVNLANNHSNDFGEAGRTTTRAALTALGIRYYGQGSGVRTDTVQVGGVALRIAFVGFAASPGMLHVRDIPTARTVVAGARRHADIVIVTMHAGAEGSRAAHVPDGPERFVGEDRGDLRRFSRAVIDAGASVVVGHGPHVLRGMEWYDGALIAYSLGNFVTAAGFELDAPKNLTAVLQIDLARTGQVTGARVVPFIQRTGRGVAADSSGATLSFIRKLSREDFGATAIVLDADGSILPQPARPRR